MRSLHLSSVPLWAYFSPTVKKTLNFGKIQNGDVHSVNSVKSESSRSFSDILSESLIPSLSPKS